MSMNFMLGDSLIRLKNGQNAKYNEVTIHFSNLIESIINLLHKEGYISSYTIEEKRKGIRVINVKPKYYNNVGVINHIKLISKPGRRVYTPALQLRKFRGGLGILIISTSKGLMPDYKALAMNLGGEVLCSVF